MGRVIYDKNFHTKNFILHYKQLVNRDEFMKDKVKYGKMLDTLSKTISVDENKSILFIGSKDIHKEIFLSLFSRYDTLQSYYYCSMMMLHDIFWGNRGSENTNILDDDKMFSLQDITQDVLCLFINREMIPTKNASVVGSVITSRCMLSHKKRNWIFFNGFVSDMLDREGYKSIYDLFNSNDDFVVVDLNKEYSNLLSSVNDSKSANNKNTKSAKVSTKHKEVSNSKLSDMY